MNYSKPEVNVLGEAKSVIEGSSKPPIHTTDGLVSPLAAYDLDE